MDDKLNAQKAEEIFVVLLAHWINHTGDHIEGYEEWAKKLKGTSKDAVSEELYLAIEKMRDVQKKMLEAKIRLRS